MEKKPAQKKTVKTTKALKPKKVVVAKDGKDLKAPIFDIKGKEVSTVTLPGQIFGVNWNADLVHQVVLGMQNNARAGRAGAHTKGRGEVRGGGKKPWRQKGTGRARHGSIRSPLWKGGGVTHGPRSDKDYSVTIPKKMRASALFSVLSRKLKDKEILFVDSITFGTPKTAEAKDILGVFSKIAGFEKMIGKKQNAALILTTTADEMVKKSFRNLGNVAVEEVRNLNAVDAMTYTYLIVVNPDEAVKRWVEKKQ
ncbi:MAG: 50S ribosomal protein L4 [Candidatus Campbellbacteria bacterium]|nr:50S ribosomal protein L4 [Candidatus Campbellbacteria bacterium]